MPRTTAANASVATPKLMKPGPAIATDAIEADSGRRATIRSAMSRGLRLAMRASPSATGLAKSPWSSPRLRSTGIFRQRIERQLPVVAKCRQRVFEE